MRSVRTTHRLVLVVQRRHHRGCYGTLLFNKYNERVRGCSGRCESSMATAHVETPEAHVMSNDSNLRGPIPNLWTTRPHLVYQHARLAGPRTRFHPCTGQTDMVPPGHSALPFLPSDLDDSIGGNLLFDVLLLLLLVRWTAFALCRTPTDFCLTGAKHTRIPLGVANSICSRRTASCCGRPCSRSNPPLHSHSC